MRKGGENMREEYRKPVAEMKKFSVVDVITTSGGGSNNDGDKPIVTPPDWDD